jgi:hypothetical protein
MATTDAISVPIEGDPQGLINAMDEAGTSVDRFARRVDNVGNTSSRVTSSGSLGFMRWAGVVAGAAAVIGGAMKGIGAAAQKEQFATQFETLLGSADAAQERLAELSKFANETPFSNNEVMQMSKMLQAMTGGALATGDGLKLVGDTAAALDPTKVDQFAMHIGRAYSAIQSGASFGESIQELQQLGAISGPVANELKKASESGQVTAATWTLLEQELKKNEGAMSRLAGTFSGATSTMAGTFMDVMADAFAPLTEALVPIIFDIVDGMEKMRPQLVKMGEFLAGIVTTIRDSLSFIFAVIGSGELGTLVLASLKLGGALFVNWFFGILTAGFEGLLGVVTGTLATLASGDFWMGVFKTFAMIGDLLIGSSMVFIGGILQAGQNWYATIIAAVGTWYTLMGAAASFAGLTLFGWILKGVEKLLQVGQKLKLPGMNDLVEKVKAARAGVEGLANGAKEVLSDPKAVFEGLKQTTAEGMDAAGKAMVDKGKEIVGRGMEAGKEGISQAGGAIGKGFEGAFDNVKFEPADIIDTEGMKTEVGDIFGKHWPKKTEEAAKATETNANKTGEAIKKAVDPSLVGDSLAKLGGGGNVFMAAISAASGSSGGGLGGTGGGGATPAEGEPTEDSMRQAPGTTGVTFTPGPGATSAGGPAPGGLEGAGSASGALGDAGTGNSAQLTVLTDMLNVMRNVRDILAEGGGGEEGGGLSIQLV